MNRRKFGISILMILMMAAAFSTSSFAAVGDSVTAEVYSKARRSCFNRGSVTLTEVVPRGLAIEADALAYHNVDEIRMRVYLQESRDGELTDLDSWIVTGKNTNHIELNKAYTVRGNASYRLHAIFTTKHSGDEGGTEGGVASTSWLWVN